MARIAKVNALRFIENWDMTQMFVPPEDWYVERLERLGLRECQECKEAFKPALKKQFWCPACRASLWASVNPV